MTLLVKDLLAEKFSFIRHLRTYSSRSMPFLSEIFSFMDYSKLEINYHVKDIKRLKEEFEYRINQNELIGERNLLRRQ